MEVPGRRGQQPTVVDRDEGPLKLNQEKLQQLRPAFSNGKAPGTVTPGNASPVTDGAAALVLTSPAKARQRGLTVSAHKSFCVCFSSAWHSQCIWVLLMGGVVVASEQNTRGVPCSLTIHLQPMSCRYWHGYGGMGMQSASQTSSRQLQLWPSRGR